MNNDPYWCCDGCAHYWAAPARPDMCENCRRPSTWLIECPDLEQAELVSEAMLDSTPETDAAAAAGWRRFE